MVVSIITPSYARSTASHSLVIALLLGWLSACQGKSEEPAASAGSAGQQSVAGANPSGGGGVGGVGAVGGGGTSGSSGNPALAGSGGSVAGAGVGGSSGAAGNHASAGAAGNAASDYCSPRPGLLFCEDFEKPAAGSALNTAPWSNVVIGDGTISVDATVHHGGSQSAYVNGSGYSTMLVFHDPAVLPAKNTRFYVRAFIRLIAPVSGEHNSLLIADRFSSPGTGNNLRVGEMYSMLMYTVAGDAHGALANDNVHTDGLPGAALTPNGFGCLELLIDPNGPELDVWLDGKEIPDLHHTDFPLDAYDALRFGFEKYGGPQRELWFDDIAIGTEKIGCN